MRISDWSSDVCSSDLLQDRKPCASDGNSILNSRYGSYMPNEDFAVQFAPGARRETCQLYLISPPAIDETFAGRLASALDAGAVAAFQLRLKGIDEHVITRADEPLQRICADRDVAFIIDRKSTRLNY